MKKIIFLLFSFIILSNYITFAQFGGGNGTVNEPYQIKTKAHLEALADSVNYGNNWSKDKYFKVMNDIQDSIQTVIGRISLDFDDTTNFFQGDFNGNNKKITLALNGDNLYFGRSCVGLFGCTFNAKIYDIIINGNIEGLYYIGGIAGYAENSTVKNCINYCNVKGSYAVAGISGWNSKVNISNCNNYGMIESDSTNGGIAGENYFANISNCVNNGNINGKKLSGGIAGSFIGDPDFQNYTLSNCYNYSNVVGSYVYTGGIAGFAGFGIDLLNCTNEGNISGNEAVGGITGCLGGDGSSILTNSINSGDISGVLAVGGITGHTHENIEISNCLNIGTVRADSFVGGIAGGYDNNFALKNGNIYNSVNSGLVIGKEIVGGIIGRCLGEVKNCINSGTVSGNSNIGCIVGEKGESAIIENCHFDKQVCGE